VRLVNIKTARKSSRWCDDNMVASGVIFVSSFYADVFLRAVYFVEHRFYLVETHQYDRMMT